MRHIVLIGSTSGGILNSLLCHKFVRDLVLEVVSDRSCGFINIASTFNMNVAVLESLNGLDFSNQLLARFSTSTDVIFLSFYTRLFQGDFITKFRNKIFNCHPSLLPLFPGMQGFSDTIKSKSKFMGSTIHIIDEGIDTGEPIIQCAIPLNRKLSNTENRGKVFLSQYYSILQLLRWIKDGRLIFSKDPQNACHVINGKYDACIFSPNLDHDFFQYIGEANKLYI
jgi:phosphoribosylglycinamide formyltransferase-1